MVVDQFFCELYWSAAERLPETGERLENVHEHIGANQGNAAPIENEVLVLDWSPHNAAMDMVGIAHYRILVYNFIRS